MKDEKLLQVDEDGLPIGFAKWANKKLPNDIGSMTIAYCEDAWRAALQSGNSAQPVTASDGWIPVIERMPERGVEVLACKMNQFGGYDEIEAAQWHGGMRGEQPVFITSADTIEPELWQPLPAAPKVK